MFPRVRNIPRICHIASYVTFWVENVLEWDDNSSSQQHHAIGWLPTHLQTCMTETLIILYTGIYLYL